MKLEGKTFLVTGGTGSFGNAFVSLALRKINPKEIRIFSRDEKKQFDMRNTYSDPRLKFIIGDIREESGLDDAMKGVDFVFHAAALKQVPTCEFFPLEAVKTNVLGANNVMKAASENKIRKVVVLSTDKAVYPINAMGMTKALMEKLVMAYSRSNGGPSVFCGVRYGNVMCSRGSVIPLFLEQIRQGKELTVTNPDMTRFLLPLSQAVELVLFALEEGNSGDVFVRKSPASTILNLAKACVSISKAKNEIKVIGVREGEKMHETLVTSEELIGAEEFDRFFRIRGVNDLNYDKFFTKGKRKRIPKEGYTSNNTRQLSVNQVEELLLSLPEVISELPK